MYLDDSIETMLMIARPAYSFLSSSVVKEIGMNRGEIAGLVPEEIEQRILDELARLTGAKQ